MTIYNNRMVKTTLVYYFYYLITNAETSCW